MKHRVTIVAIGALLALCVAVYFARDLIAPGPNAVAGVKGEVKAEAGQSDAKAAAGKAQPVPARRRRSRSSR